jgi:hypothetical protein
VRKLHDRVDEPRRVGVGGDRGDERAAELQLVDREPPDVAERGVAGAEVVDREPDPEDPVHGRVGARPGREPRGRQRGKP